MFPLQIEINDTKISIQLINKFIIKGNVNLSTKAPSVN